MHFASGCFRNDQLIVLYIEKEGSLLALCCFLERGQFSSQVGLGPSGRQSASMTECFSVLGASEQLFRIHHLHIICNFEDFCFVRRPHSLMGVQWSLGKLHHLSLMWGAPPARSKAVNVSCLYSTPSWLGWAKSSVDSFSKQKWSSVFARLTMWLHHSDIMWHKVVEKGRGPWCSVCPGTLARLCRWLKEWYSDQRL